MKRLLIIFSLLFSVAASSQVKVLGGLVTNGPGDTYPTHYDSLGRGGFRVVADITERDAIPVQRRKQGMVVSVLSDGKWYSLSGGVGNAAWQEVVFASAGKLNISDTPDMLLPYRHWNAGYLKSYTETDPTVAAHIKSITTTNILNWNQGYNSVTQITDTSFTFNRADGTRDTLIFSLAGGTSAGGNGGITQEYDPTVPDHVKTITAGGISNWNTAFTNSHTHANKSILDGITANDIANWNNDLVGATTLAGLNDVTITSPAASHVLTNDGSRWVNKASASIDMTGFVAGDYVIYNGVNFVRGAGGGITTETDPTVAAHIKSITTTNILNWNQGYNSVTQITDTSFTFNRADGTRDTLIFSLAGGTSAGGNGGITQEYDPTVPDHVKTITAGGISNWNTAFTNSHTHANKSILDGITANDIANWNNDLVGATTLAGLNDVTITSPAASHVLTNDGSRWVNKASASIDMTGFVAGDYVIYNGVNFVRGAGGGITTETDPTVGSHIKGISTTNISNWNAGYNDKINSIALAYSGGSLSATLTQQDGGTVVSNNIPAASIDMAGFVNNDVPVYNGTNFVRKASASIDMAGFTSGDYVQFNGTNFVRAPAPSGGSSGTVTSVGLSVPTGLSVTGSPVTSSGTLAIGLQSGYSIPTTANQANWNTAFTNSHSHLNKTLLDGIRPIDTTRWAANFFNSDLRATDWREHSFGGYGYEVRDINSYIYKFTDKDDPTVFGTVHASPLSFMNEGRNAHAFYSLTALIQPGSANSLYQLRASSMNYRQLTNYADVSVKSDTTNKSEAALTALFHDNMSYVSAKADSVVIRGTKNGIDNLTLKVIGLSQISSPTHQLAYNPITKEVGFAPVSSGSGGTAINGTGFVKANGTTITYDNNTYEPAFSKNTAFNKAFGTAAGTVAEGNDSRILNGQTAFGWGNHSSQGYIKNITGLISAGSNVTISGTGTPGSPYVISAVASGSGADGNSFHTGITAANGTIALSSTNGAGAISATASGTWGISISGNAATVTNGLYSTGSYANPAWLTSLAYSKLTGAPTALSSFTNDAGYVNSIAHAHGIANSAGAQQFTYGVGESIRFAATGNASVSFDAATKTITIGATAGSGADGNNYHTGITAADGTIALSSSNGAPALSVSASGSWNINAATVTNGIYSTGSYANPTWLTSLAATKVTGLATVATTGSYNSLSDRPTIPAAQVNADWNASTGVSAILNKPATFTPSAHTHTIPEVTGLQTALDGKAATSHTHTIPDVSGLQTTLDSKQATLVSGTNIKTINGQSLLGSGNINISGGGSGTVTSVSAADIPGFATGIVSNETTTPVITFGLQTQAANTFFAGGVSASGVPTFRKLSSVDIPFLNANIIASGTFSDRPGLVAAGTQTDGYVAKLVGGVVTWSAEGGSKTLNVVKALAIQNYTVTATDDYIELPPTNGANRLITIPSPNGQTGRKLIIAHKGTATGLHSWGSSVALMTPAGTSTWEFEPMKIYTLISDGNYWMVVNKL